MADNICMTCGHTFLAHGERLDCFADVGDGRRCECNLFDVAPYDAERNPDPRRRFIDRLIGERDEAVAAERERCAWIADAMVVGGRQWTHGQADASKVLRAVAANIRDPEVRPPGPLRRI